MVSVPEPIEFIVEVVLVFGLGLLLFLIFDISSICLRFDEPKILSLTLLGIVKGLGSIRGERCKLWDN